METLVSATPTCRQSRANNLLLCSSCAFSGLLNPECSGIKKRAMCSLSCSGTPGDLGGKASEVPSCRQAFWAEEYLGEIPEEPWTHSPPIWPFSDTQAHQVHGAGMVLDPADWIML